MRKEERDALIREETTQIRIALGETMGRLAPDVQLKHQQCLDALERIDRLVEHGVGPGEAPPKVLAGVPGEGLTPEEKAAKLPKSEPAKAGRK